MTDGSHIGTTAARAVRTILGANPDQPVLDERDSPQAVLNRLMDCPLPGDGVPIWERPNIDPDMAYSLATDCIARAMLETTEDKHCDTDCGAAWDRANARWWNLDEWIDGASGFQVGFAWNLVRYIKNWGETSNPALLSL